MADRSVLGPADVTDDELTEIVAGWIGADVGSVALVSAPAEVVPYDLDAITTAGRYWLRGKVRHAGGVTDFSFFIKHVQSWARSPQLAAIPPHLVEVAEAGVPWRTEPLISEATCSLTACAGVTSS